MADSDKPINWPAMGAPSYASAFLNLRDDLREIDKRNYLALKSQIEGTEAARTMSTDPRNPQALSQSSVPLQDHVLASNAVLTFQSSAKIGAKIKDLKTESGHQMIEETTGPNGKRQRGIWNEATQSRSLHEEIYAERSENSKIQYSSHYDKTHGCLTIDLGGTDFGSGTDLGNAVQTRMGGVTPRMTETKRLIDKTMAEFERLHPGMLASTPVDIYAHSAGAAAVPLANYFLQRGHNVVPRAQVMFDPYGAKDSLRTVGEMIAGVEKRDPKEVTDELARNAISYKTKNGTFVDFKISGSAKETFGEVRTIDLEGNSFTAHFGKPWIKGFNHAEMQRGVSIDDNAPIISKHMGSQVQSVLPAQPPKEALSVKLSASQKADIAVVQKELRRTNVYTGLANGEWNRESNHALNAYLQLAQEKGKKDGSYKGDVDRKPGQLTRDALAHDGVDRKVISAMERLGVEGVFKKIYAPEEKPVTSSQNAPGISAAKMNGNKLTS